MHCFEGHTVVTLGEMASKDSARHDIHELDALCKFIQVKLKTLATKANVLNLKEIAGRSSQSSRGADESEEFRRHPESPLDAVRFTSK